MIIPLGAISSEALEGMIEEFVTRDGTDYGFEETSLSQRVAQIKRKLMSKEIVILYNEATEDVNLVLSEKLREK